MKDYKSRSIRRIASNGAVAAIAAAFGLSAALLFLGGLPGTDVRAQEQEAKADSEREPVGAICASDAECRTGVCQKQGTARFCIEKRPVDAVCHRDKECQSDICMEAGVNDLCMQPQPSGVICYRDKECASGECTLLAGETRTCE